MLKKCTLLFLINYLSASLFAQNIQISKKELDSISERIYQNECACKEKNLTCWNKGENFASLGIGHFIWYPEGIKKVFDESFPKLLAFLRKNKVAIPQWLDKADIVCPWNSRKSFYNDFNKTKMRSLRILLKRTMTLQAEFMALRLQRALPKMLNSADYSKEFKQHIKTQFYRVAYSPMGMYVLIDYVNFKGEGVLETERYKGQGWGLLQVLGNMKGNSIGSKAVNEFMDSAKLILKRRVENSPKNRNEAKWLPGWYNRLESYKN